MSENERDEPVDPVEREEPDADEPQPWAKALPGDEPDGDESD